MINDDAIYDDNVLEWWLVTAKKGKQHGLLTINTKLKFEKGYKIYSTRWTIEVFFKECKQFLRLGKCETLHFDAQIATTTICMLQYNGW